MKISIITVCFNSEKFIQRCIDSVRCQKTSVSEHILIDGNSTDKTLEILNKYINYDDGYKKTIISEKDDGVYDAMNKGLNMAKGDYVWFLNSDDKITDCDVVSDIRKILFKDKSTMIVGSTRIMNEKNIVRMYNPILPNKRFIPQQPHPSLLVSLEFLLTNNITFDSQKLIASDYKMQLEVIKNGGEMSISNRVFSDMYVGGISNSSIKYKFLGWFESYIVFNEVFGSGGLKNTMYKIFSKLHQFRRK